jgi:hypothetical protein
VRARGVPMTTVSIMAHCSDARRGQTQRQLVVRLQRAAAGGVAAEERVPARATTNSSPDSHRRRQKLTPCMAAQGSHLVDPGAGKTDPSLPGLVPRWRRASRVTISAAALHEPQLGMMRIDPTALQNCAAARQLPAILRRQAVAVIFDAMLAPKRSSSKS